ncbi:hypothetical protein MMC20_006215 [Loxospora ochrophaea]|nr:hypothetical protein [Loxospora ochrophaea]
MDDSPGTHHSPQDTSDTTVMSLRSRASSVRSTGTKVSISTIPPDNAAAPGAEFSLLARRSFRITQRPGSILSISSVDQQPAPPYSPLSSPNDQTLPPPHTIPPPQSSPQTETAPQTHTSTPPASSANTSSTPSPTSPLPFPDAETLSQHYSTIVRTLDASHTREVASLAQTHTLELSSQRHAIDAAYRRELYAREREVEKIREEAATAVAGMEAEVDRVKGEMEGERRRMEVEAERRIEKARNEVEDMWEARWKDRSRVVGEEVRRAVEERDERWAREVGRRWPGLEAELRGLQEEIAMGDRNGVEGAAPDFRGRRTWC